MLFDTCEQEILKEIAETAVWSENCINIFDSLELSVLDFYIFRKMFKDLFDQKAESKQKLVESSFEMAKKCTEAICKTIAGAYGTKAGSPDYSNKK